MPPRFEIRDAAAAHVVERELAVARLLGELVDLDGDLADVFLVRVANHRHEQTPVGVHRHADVHVFLVDDFAALHVQRGVELRELLHGGREDLTSIAVTVRLPPALATCSRYASAVPPWR